MYTSVWWAMCTLVYGGLCVHQCMVGYVYTSVWWAMCTLVYGGLCVH